jgi:hypothetical protein
MGTINWERFDVIGNDDLYDYEASNERLVEYANALIEESGTRVEIVDANVLSAAAVSTGYEGGNSGCVTAVAIKDLASTQWSLAVETADDLTLKAVYIVTEGDSEVRTLATALRWIADQIERQASSRAK